MRALESSFQRNVHDEFSVLCDDRQELFDSLAWKGVGIVERDFDLVIMFARKIPGRLERDAGSLGDLIFRVP